MKTAVFFEIKAQINQLFKCQENKVVFEAAFTDDSGKSHGARGYFWNHYREVRRSFHLAGFYVGRDTLEPNELLEFEDSNGGIKY